MNCPVCKRELAPTLSICLTCGAMMHDTVREELESKVVRPSAAEISKTEIPKFEPILPGAPQPVKSAQPVAIPAAPVAAKLKTVTAKLKKETSPTLVDFQHTNPAIPDWRLELQNTVRKRNVDSRSMRASIPPIPVSVSDKTTTFPEKSIANTPEPAIQNEKLANAMKRIEASKKTFGSGAAVGIAAAAHARAKMPPVPNRSYPFDVVERKPQTESAQPPTMPAAVLPKPKLVQTIAVERKKFDTNKLPPIPEPEVSFDGANESKENEAENEIPTRVSFDRLQIRNIEGFLESSKVEAETPEEIDDLAPFSMRFGAAVFDLIIGGFAAGIVLSPFLISNTVRVSSSGLFAAFGGALFVMFLYFTGSIAVMGRTFGMKLFSIEIIDAEANELPSFHQAAVHSAVYLLSLMFLGIGFLPAFFNEERRAMHDLVSGTLLIREY